MIADAIAYAFGLSSVTCDAATGCGVQGWIAGTIFAVILAIILTFAIGGRKSDNTTVFLIGLLIGGFINSGFGWFPMWFPIAVVVVLLFITIDPFGVRKSSGGA